jgi:hypothetical protein
LPPQPRATAKHFGAARHKSGCRRLTLVDPAQGAAAAEALASPYCAEPLRRFAAQLRDTTIAIGRLNFSAPTSLIAAKALTDYCLALDRIGMEVQGAMIAQASGAAQ